MFKQFSPLLILPALAAILAFGLSLQYSFFQDDFINFSASKVSNPTDFLNFFNPYTRFPDLFFFRPLSTQFWYFINHSLFGVNALPFHIEALILHIANSYLIYIATMMLFRKKNLALISSTLYALSAVHFISLYYISTFQELAKTFFMLLGVITFTKFKLWSYASFILALLSKESAIIFPLYLVVFETFRRREENWLAVVKETLMKSVPIFITLFLLQFLLILPHQQIQAWKALHE